MTTTMQSTSLNALIEKAMAKVSASKESELARYLPEEDSSNSRMHHFSYERIKKNEPQKMQKMLKDYILDQQRPKGLPSPPRKARGANGTRGQLRVSADLIKKVADRLETVGDRDLLAELEPMIKSDAQIVKELILAIRSKERAVDLWEAYVRRVAKD